MNILLKIQAYLQKNNYYGVLIRSSDEYLNEYVPKESSLRYYVTQFDGSMGDAFITQNSAHLFVDGRYILQAKEQATDYEIHVTKSGESIEKTWLDHLQNTVKKSDILLYDQSVMEISLFDKLNNFTLKAFDNTFTSFIGFNNFFKEQYSLWTISDDYCQPLKEKILIFNDLLKQYQIDGLLLTKLDDIAFATNMRSDYFAYQATIPAIAVLLKDKIMLGFNQNVYKNIDSTYVFSVNISDFFNNLKKNINTCLGVDESELTKRHQELLHNANISLKALLNPLALKKAIKHEKELLHMRQAFKKADEVVFQTINYAKKSYQEDKKLSEGEIQDYLQDCFKRSNAQALSFKPICAAGKNGAIVHYNTPNYQEKIPENSLFLLDTGAFYEGGYATDLTRTFLLGTQACAWQKSMFTLVLKASIAGLSARLKVGSSALHLDGIVRNILWQNGLDFAHGTGHGVGINVHEFPPRIGPKSHNILQEHQVFSIEPGIYIEGLGGVRIENLVCLIKDPECRDFLRVQPLTFCPFDEDLIDFNILNDKEKDFLNYYKDQWQNNNNPMPNNSKLNNQIFL